MGYVCVCVGGAVKGSRVPTLGGMGKTSSTRCAPELSSGHKEWGNGRGKMGKETRQSWKATPKDHSLRKNSLIRGIPADFVGYKTLNGVQKASVGERSKEWYEKPRAQ